jgi:hypothetical protein
MILGKLSLLKFHFDTLGYVLIMFAFLDFNSSTYILALLLSIQFVTIVNFRFRFGSDISRLSDINSLHSLFGVDEISLDPNLVVMVTTYNESSNPEVPKDPNCTTDACGL